MRHYLDQRGDAFEISISIHPADRFKFSMRLKREQIHAGRIATTSPKRREEVT